MSCLNQTPNYETVYGGNMTDVQLQALLEFDSGEFHAFQCYRSENKRDHRHAECSRAHDWLIEHDMIKLIGEEFFLTEYGKDVRDTALQAATKFMNTWEGK